jgi:hypothetical protein
MQLVIDIPTSRVIFFSEDRSNITQSMQTVTVLYKGIMPQNMTVNNCWNWKLVGKELINTVDNQEIDTQKNLLIAHINKTCDAEYKKLPAEIKADIILEISKFRLSELVPILEALSKASGKSILETIEDIEQKIQTKRNGLKIIEFIRTRFLEAIKFCKADTELLAVRKEFAVAQFTEQYIDSKDRELINILDETVDTENLLNEVIANYDDFTKDTKRQENLYVQADTRIIQLVKGVMPANAPPGFLLWDSKQLERSEFYDKYTNVIAWVTDYANKNSLKIARVAIVEIINGGSVKPHIDCGEYYRDYDRYHLCIQGSYSYHVLNATKVINKNTLFKFDNKFTHWAEQLGQDTRISIIFDAAKMS